MKKFLIFVILVVAGYLVYNNLIKEKEVLEVRGSLVKIKEGVNIDAPAIQPRTWGHIEGKVKNISEDNLKNIEIIYKINGKESVAKLSELAPGEESNFKTERVMLTSYEASHFLEKVTYTKE